MKLFLLIVLLAVSFSYAYGAEVNNCQFVQPTYGRIACEPIQSVNVENLYRKADSIFELGILDEARSTKWQKVSGTGWSAWQIFEACGDDENTKVCESYAFQCGPQRNDATKCGLNGVKYRICDGPTADKCPASWINIPGGDFFGEQSFAKREFAVGTAKGKYINVWANVNFLVNADDTNPLLYSRYIAFGLNSYERGAKYRINVRSCNLNVRTDSLGDFFQSKNVMQTCPTNVASTDINNVCAETIVDSKSGLNLRDSQTLAYDDWINYLMSFDPAIVDLNNAFFVKTDGTTIYLLSGAGGIPRIFEIQKITTQSGACYSIPAKEIANDGSIKCIPGQESANNRCVKDGDKAYWAAIQTTECTSDSGCQQGYTCQQNKCVIKAQCFSDLQCPGSGAFITDTTQSTPSIVSYKCENSLCVVKERKQVACTPPATNCASGTFCDPAKYVCVTQIGGVPAPPPPGFDFLNALGNFVGAFIIAVIILFVIWILGKIPSPLAIVFGPIASFLNFKMFIIAAIVLTILMFFLFGGLSANVTASIMGGS